MKTSNGLLILTVCLYFSLTNIYSQQRCGMMKYMEEMMKNPEYAKAHQKRQEKFKVQLQTYLSNEDYARQFNQSNTIEIPVAVHFPEASESERACLEALAQNQIDIINADYSATNSDIATWNSISNLYPGTTAGAANVSFCLATINHPTGLDPELIEGNPCVTIGYNFGNGNNTDSNWSGYLNFVVRDIGPGLLGFSPLGGSVANGDAVTMNLYSFGSGSGCTSVVPQAPYNLGRTVTHELGHFFNLRHTFNGDGNGTCGNGQGDGLTDTPEVANSTYGCTTPGSIDSCISGQPALTMNYMDYSDDACMYMFSQDQINVAEAWIIINLQSNFNQTVCPSEPTFEISAIDTEVYSCPNNTNEVDFNFNYITISGFSENTTFTASGLPPGASASFNPSSINTNGVVTLTLGNIGATSLGTYNITITGTSSTTAETKSIDVILNNNCTEIVCDTYASPQNLGLAITDGTNNGIGTPVASNTINIPDTGVIESITVTVDIDHTYVQDLIIQLQHPNGSDFINLWVGECDSENNLTVTFDDNANSVDCPGGNDDTISGTIAPSNPLSAFNGLDIQGDWILAVADVFAGDTGQINNWAVEICSEQTTLSFDDVSLNDLRVYPNPNNGEFRVAFSPKSGEVIKIDIYDIRGRAIFSKAFKNVADFNESITLNNAQSGMYLLNVSNGNQSVTKKIVID